MCYKAKLSVAQVLLGEFHDIFNELEELVNNEEDMHSAVRVNEQTMRGWVEFERDIKGEIEYLNNNLNNL